jgi:hydrogenase maturation protease
MNTIVIGLGNPVLSDDGAGLEVARRVAARLKAQRGALSRAAIEKGTSKTRRDVTVVEVYGGGIRLMEAMAGYDCAVIADAMVTGARPGTIARLDPTALGTARHLDSTHDASLAVALELGKAAGMRLPGDIRIWAVEAADVQTVREGLSPAVEQAVFRMVEGILAEAGIPGSPAAAEQS